MKAYIKSLTNQKTNPHAYIFLLLVQRNVQEFVLSSGWFIGIFASTTIGNSNYFGFGFMMLN